MGSLSGQTPADSFQKLLQVDSANGVDGTTRNVEDGEGTASALQLSTSEVNINGALKIGGVAADSTLDPIKSRASFGTCLATGCNITINADTTKIDVSAGTGFVVDNHTTPGDAIVTSVTYPGVTAIPLTYLATAPATFLSIDSSGTLIQTLLPPANEDRRDRFYIGVVTHADNVEVKEVLDFSLSGCFSASETLSDFSDMLGPITTSGVDYSANGANLSLDRSAGEMFWPAINFKANAKNPSALTIAQDSATGFYETWRDGSGDWVIRSTAVTTIDPSIYDDGTGTASDPGGVVADYQWQVMEIKYSPTIELNYIQWGQAVFESKAAALASIASNGTTQNPALGAVPKRAFIAIKGDATDLSDSAQAVVKNLGPLPYAKATTFEQLDGISNLSHLNSGGQLGQMRVVITSSGGTITASIDRDGGGNIVFQCGDKSLTLDTVPAVDVTLTNGTDTSPISNYIYATHSGGTITLSVSTTGFPTSGWWSAVARVVVQSASTVESSGPLSLQLWSDHVAAVGDRGHLLEMSERIRQDYAAWAEGVVGSVTVSSNDVWFETTVGAVYQLHRLSWPATDSGSGGGNDLIHVVNDNTTPYTTINSINAANDSGGNSLNNRSFSVVLWGSISSEGTGNVYANLPTTGYNGSKRDDDALADISNTAVYTIPNDLKSTGFLISRVVIRNSGGTPTIVGTIDLRGSAPGAFGGGVAGAQSLQSVYDNSSNPEIVVDSSNGAITIRDNATPIADNLLEVQSNDGNTDYLAVKADGVFLSALKSGASQVNAGAAADELWIDTADNSIKIGV